MKETKNIVQLDEKLTPYRVQDVLPPYLLRDVLEDWASKTDVRELNFITKALGDKVFDLLDGLDMSKKGEILGKVKHLQSDILGYFNKNKFYPRKRVIALTSWCNALHESGGIYIAPGTEYRQAIDLLFDEIDRWHDKIDGFEKIEMSAIKHVSKIHKICQKEGYY